MHHWFWHCIDQLPLSLSLWFPCHVPTFRVFCLDVLLKCLENHFKTKHSFRATVVVCVGVSYACTMLLLLLLFPLSTCLMPHASCTDPIVNALSVYITYGLYILCCFACERNQQHMSDGNEATLIRATFIIFRKLQFLHWKEYETMIQW